MTPPPPRRRTYVGTRQELGPDEPAGSGTTPGSGTGSGPPARTPAEDRAPGTPGSVNGSGRTPPEPPELLDPESTDDSEPDPEPGAAIRPAGPGGWLRPGDGADVLLRLAGRFPDPYAAAAYLGALLDVASARARVGRADGAWWVLADVRLTLARELVELAGGTIYRAGGERLIRDRGWGPPPDPQAPPADDDLPATALIDVPVTDLVTAAGLRRRPVTPDAALTVLVPAARAASLLRRTSDLGLQAAFRPARLRPLFGTDPGSTDFGSDPGSDPGSTDPGDPAEDDDAGGSLVELRLRAPAGGRRTLPATLVRALDDDHHAVVLREAAPALLVQHDRQSPLSDRQLAALVETGTWVVADAPFGCWSLEPLGEFSDATALMTFGPAHRLEAGDSAVLDAGSPSRLPEPIRVSVVPANRRSGAVDAVLLREAELATVRLVLEGHPLADEAFIVPGRDHHLLIASGGIAERIPLGRYLTAVLPQAVYLPHGWRTDPLLPPSLYATLADRVPGHALVLEAERTLVFDLAGRRPVWALWAGDLPAVDLQVAPAIDAVLAEVDRAVDPWGQRALPPPPPVPAPTGGGRLRNLGRDIVDRLRDLAEGPKGPLTWQQQAMAAEVAGDFVRAARLHEDNGSPLKAAQLYEHAAKRGAGEQTA